MTRAHFLNLLTRLAPLEPDHRLVYKPTSASGLSSSTLFHSVPSTV